MRKIISIVLLIISVVCLSFGFAACRDDKEDCIPEKLGKAEGLYLYYDNYRSLTDGTETSRLVNELVLEDKTYTIDEYRIVEIEYILSTKEILYSIRINKEGEGYTYLLWHYNYDNKTSGFVKSFNDYIYISTSEKYVLARTNVKTNKEGALFDLNLNLVLDGVGEYSLGEDTLYSVGNTEFKWWRNGKFHQITFPSHFVKETFEIGEKYAQILGVNRVCSIDLNTEEYVITPYTVGTILDPDFGYTIITIEDRTYFITYTTLVPTEYERYPLYTGCSLYVVQGFNLKCLRIFDKKYQVSFEDFGNGDYVDFNDTFFNLQFEYVPEIKNPMVDRNVESIPGFYKVKTNRLVMGRTKYVKRETEREATRFKIEGYEFYIDSVSYGPIISSYRCYYLHRVFKGKDEIVQYYFDEGQEEPNPILFDVIYVK